MNVIEIEFPRAWEALRLGDSCLKITRIRKAEICKYFSSQGWLWNILDEAIMYRLTPCRKEHDLATDRL